MNIGKDIMNYKIHNKNNTGIQKAWIDVDETICFYRGDRIYELAEPSLENISKINKLYDCGWHITYWTARGGSSGINYYNLTKQQLGEWGAKYHDLSVGEKPFYDLVVDDKAKRIEEL
jgi:hypothetical protein